MGMQCYVKVLRKIWAVEILYLITVGMLMMLINVCDRSRIERIQKKLQVSK